MRPEEHHDYTRYVSARIVPLRRFAYLVCGDWHRAEDAVQTALVKLYLNWSRPRWTNLDAYVRKMVVNALHDVHRRKWFRRERSRERLPDAPRYVENDDERLVLLEALSTLPLRRRTTLVLRFWEDLSVQQTAEVMGCSVATVKSQTARGLQTLRGLLKDFNQVEGGVQ